MNKKILIASLLPFALSAFSSNAATNQTTEFSNKVTIYTTAKDTKQRLALTNEVKFGKALDILQQLDLISFDLVFIDAAKKEYQKYYDLLVNHLHSDSILLIDNVLWRGEVWKKDKKSIGKSMDAFNKYVRSPE